MRPRNNSYKIPQQQPPVFLQMCAAILFMGALWYVGGFILSGLLQAIGSIW